MNKQAVVVIDVQNAIVDLPGATRTLEARAALDLVVAKIARLLEWARQRNTPVLFVQHDGGPGSRLARGTPGWEIRREIAPAAGEPVIEKNACDSFFETSLGRELEARQAKELIVAGCMTQWCVDTTVRRSVTLGYDVLLVADGHMTADLGALKFEQIIAHHNLVLDGFEADSHTVRVLPLDKILNG